MRIQRKLGPSPQGLSDPLRKAVFKAIMPFKLGSDIIRFALYKDVLDYGVNGRARAGTPIPEPLGLSR